MYSGSRTEETEFLFLAWQFLNSVWNSEQEQLYE